MKKQKEKEKHQIIQNLKKEKNKNMIDKYYKKIELQILNEKPYNWKKHFIFQLVPISMFVLVAFIFWNLTMFSFGMIFKEDIGKVIQKTEIELEEK